VNAPKSVARASGGAAPMAKLRNPKPGDRIFGRVEKPRRCHSAGFSPGCGGTTSDATGVNAVVLGDRQSPRGERGGKGAWRLGAPGPRSRRALEAAGRADIRRRVHGHPSRQRECSVVTAAAAAADPSSCCRGGRSCRGCRVHAITCDTDGITAPRTIAGATLAPDALARAASFGSIPRACSPATTAMAFSQLFPNLSSPADPEPTSTTTAPYWIQ